MRWWAPKQDSRQAQGPERDHRQRARGRRQGQEQTDEDVFSCAGVCDAVGVVFCDASWWRAEAACEAVADEGEGGETWADCGQAAVMAVMAVVMVVGTGMIWRISGWGSLQQSTQAILDMMADSSKHRCSELDSLRYKKCPRRRRGTRAWTYH